MSKEIFPREFAGGPTTSRPFSLVLRPEREGPVCAGTVLFSLETDLLTRILVFSFERDSLTGTVVFSLERDLLTGTVMLSVETDFLT